jgi:hypothetical protein
MRNNHVCRTQREAVHLSLRLSSSRPWQRSRPISVAGLLAPSPPPPASAPAGLLPVRMGFTLAAPLQQPTRARSSSISPAPRKRYTVALGEPIMKPRVSAALPPISVGDDDDDDDGANDASNPMRCSPRRLWRMSSKKMGDHQRARTSKADVTRAVTYRGCQSAH